MNRALIGRSQSFLLINQPALAINDLKKVEYQSGQSKLIGTKELILGVSYIQVERYQLAIKHLTNAIRLLPNEEQLIRIVQWLIKRSIIMILLLKILKDH